MKEAFDNLDKSRRELWASMIDAVTVEVLWGVPLWEVLIALELCLFVIVIVSELLT